MLAPSWLDTPTQAIGIGDVLRYLREAPGIAETLDREIQIGAAEILTYGGMLDGMAEALGLAAAHGSPCPCSRRGSRRIGSVSSHRSTRVWRGP